MVTLTVQLDCTISFTMLPYGLQKDMCCFKIGVEVEEHLKMKALLQIWVVVILLPNDYDNVK